MKPPFSPWISPISAQTCLVLYSFLFYFPLFILYSVFLLQVNICFFCSSVCENEWTYSYMYVLQTKKKIWSPSLLIFQPLNVETRCGVTDVDKYFGLWGKNDPFKTKKKEINSFKRLPFVVRYCMLSVSPQLHIAVVSFPTLLNWGTRDTLIFGYCHEQCPKYYLFASKGPKVKRSKKASEVWKCLEKPKNWLRKKILTFKSVQQRRKTLDYCFPCLHIFLHCGIFFIYQMYIFLMFEVFTPVRFVLPC